MMRALFGTLVLVLVLMTCVATTFEIRPKSNAIQDRAFLYFYNPITRIRTGVIDLQRRLMISLNRFDAFSWAYQKAEGSGTPPLGQQSSEDRNGVKDVTGALARSQGAESPAKK
jgi:hypothetical protein